MYIFVGEHQIKPEHREDFIKAMIANAKGSVENEPGCFRYDVIQDYSDPNCFYLYEVFTDRKAHDVDHVAMLHLKTLLSIPGWSDWHVYRSKRVNAHNIWPNDKGMQVTTRELSPNPKDPPRTEGGSPAPYLFYGTWQIKPEHREAYIKGMSANAKGSAEDEPGCYRFDVIQDDDDPNRFYLYEVFADQKAHDDSHVKAPHLLKLMNDPGWPSWPVDGWQSTMVHGYVIWSHDSWKR